MTYEERLERDIQGIHEQILGISQNIEEALKNAIHALLTGDDHLAYATILGDHPINRDCRELLRASHRFVARHLPSAGHLRFISSVMRLSDELERIGDYAVTICRETVQLHEKPPVTILRDVDLLADQTLSMFRQAVRSFDQENAEMARGIMSMAAQIGRTVDRVFQDLVKEGGQRSRPVEDLFGLLIVFNRLSRVAARSKNVCEATIFTVTGETKSPKHYRVLFVDAHNSRASQLAEAIARKAFPEQGQYQGGGWEPAPALDSDLIEFLDSHGLSYKQAKPRPLPTFEELGDFHVIVGLEKGAKEAIQPIPFHVVFQEWKLDALPLAEQDLQKLHQVLCGKIEELIETLWGHGE